MNKSVAAAISHNENKDILLNNKYIRHSINRTQSKDYRIGTHEINKIYTQNNRYDGWALGHQS